MTGPGAFRAYLKVRKKVNTNLCPCGLEAETAEHVLTECIRFTGGRSMDWDNITIDHIKYIKKIVLKLWKLENPNFRIK